MYTLHALLSILAAQSAPGGPVLWRDLAQGPRPPFSVSAVIDAGDFALLDARSDPPRGASLWRTDGTEGGTALVTVYSSLDDVAPAFGGARAGNYVVFVLDDGVRGLSAWSSDGTYEGTHPLVDLIPRTGDSEVTAPVALGDFAYFGAQTALGAALFRTDGTSAGTVRIDPAVDWDPLDVPTELAVAGSTLYISKFHALWASDGTPQGTREVARFASSPSRMVGEGDRLFFVADDGLTGEELWMFDGALHLVEDLRPGAGGALLVGPKPFLHRGEVYVVAAADGRTPSLYRTGGAAPVLQHVLDFVLFPDALVSTELGILARLYSELHVLRDGATALEKLDGELDLRDPRREPLFAAVNGRIVYSDDTCTLRSFDGSTTVALLEQETYCHPTSGGVALGAFYLDTKQLSGDEGAFVTDGTPAGTRYLGALLEPASAGSAPRGWAVAANRLFFDADDERGRTLFAAADNVDDPPLRLTSAGYGTVVEHRGFAFYLADDLTLGARVERFDPATGETAVLRAFSSSRSRGIRGLFALPKALVFIVDISSEDEVWTSDGTTAGTRSLVHIEGWTERYSEPFVFGDHLYFSGGTEQVGREPAITDGTPEGTRVIIDLFPGMMSSDPQSFIAYGSRVLFTAREPSGESALFITDGTADATKRLTGGLSTYTPMAIAGTRIVCFTSSTETGFEPHMSDGNEGSPLILLDIVPGERGSSPESPVSIGELVFFTADDEVHGRELWVTDGTPSGTKMFDLFPGKGSSRPRAMTVIDGVLWFSANDGATGRETWISDGTGEGTHLVADGLPGIHGNAALMASYEDRYTAFEGRVYFAGYDPEHGVEPWYFTLSEGTVPVEPPPPPTPPGPVPGLAEDHGCGCTAAERTPGDAELWGGGLMLVRLALARCTQRRAGRRPIAASSPCETRRGSPSLRA